jgi:L-fuconolactonase
MTIDAHVHFWNFDPVRDAWITDEMKTLQRDFLPEHLSEVLNENKIDGCIAVQAVQNESETIFLTELSAKNRNIKGIVGWVDLQDKKVTERLEYFSQFPVIKGWRHIVQSEPAGFLSRENFHRGIQALSGFDYTYDLLIYHYQLEEALVFVSKFPEQKIIIDHCAKPDIRNGKLNEWKMYIAEMAQLPKVYCKISGLFTETKWNEWNENDFYPYLDIVVECFGTDRLVFGSDWPVLQLSGTYHQWKKLLENYLERFPVEEKKKIFGLNAVQFYQL